MNFMRLMAYSWGKLALFIPHISPLEYLFTGF